MQVGLKPKCATNFTVWKHKIKLIYKVKSMKIQYTVHKQLCTYFGHCGKNHSEKWVQLISIYATYF